MQNKEHRYQNNRLNCITYNALTWSIFKSDAWIALLTLTFLEIVLGIDNIIFISIATGKLPVEQRKKATK
jgi:predicted tellurium resistance membrane protein TerC